MTTTLAWQKAGTAASLASGGLKGEQLDEFHENETPQYFIEQWCWELRQTWTPEYDDWRRRQCFASTDRTGSLRLTAIDIREIDEAIVVVPVKRGRGPWREIEDELCCSEYWQHAITNPPEIK